MMGDHLKKVKSGDPLRLPAATLNTFIDASRDCLERQQNVGGDPGPVGELRAAACGGHARVIQLRPPKSLLATLGRISRLGLQDTPVLWGNRGAFFGYLLT
jgi:hypothetical protein